MTTLELPLKRKERPDAEARRLLLQLRLGGSPKVASLSIQTVRRAWQLCVKAFATRAPVASVEQLTISSGERRIALRVYRGSKVDNARPSLVWFHGGGFVFGDLYTAGATCRAIAARTGATVVAVDYSLVPEHTMEQALEDCVVATRWVFENATKIGVTPSLVAVGGDSAGGTFAALVSHELQASEHRPVAQVLVYPATDLARERSSLDEEIPVLTTTHVHWLRDIIARVSDDSDPRLSPLRNARFDNLPATILVTAGFDPLLDEAIDYARQAESAGVPVHQLHYPGQFHGFLSFDRVLVGANDALERICGALGTVFSGGALETKAETVSVSLGHALREPLWLKPSQRWNELVVTCLLFQSLVRPRQRA